MRLSVKVKPGSRHPDISRSGDAIVVAVRERAHDGLANDAVIHAVAAWLKLPPSRITVESGAASRHKRLAITGIDDAAYAAALGRL